MSLWNEITPESSAVAYYERVQEMVRTRKAPRIGRRLFHEPARERKPWKLITPETVEEIIRLLKAGYTQKKIGDMVGCSQTKVGTVAIAHGLGTGKGHYQTLRGKKDRENHV